MEHFLRIVLCLLIPTFLIDSSFALECSFYLDQNKKHKCVSEENYMMNYGDKFCHEFTKVGNSKESSVKLKAWISKTRTCLQDMLIEGEKRHKWNCGKLKEFAFDVHSACYKVFGVCSLHAGDIYKVAKVIMKNDFIGDFEKEKRATMLQILNVTTSCMATKKVFSQSGDLFYNLMLKNRVRFGVKALNLLFKIIDLIPSTKKEMKRFFSIVLSSMYSGLGFENLGDNSVSKFSSVLVIENASGKESKWIEELPKSTSRQEIKVFKSIYNKNIEVEDLKKGLEAAKLLSSKSV